MILLILGILCMNIKTDKLVPIPQIIGLVLMITACLTDTQIKKTVKRN